MDTSGSPENISSRNYYDTNPFYKSLSALFLICISFCIYNFPRLSIHDHNITSRENYS